MTVGIPNRWWRRGRKLAVLAVLAASGGLIAQPLPVSLQAFDLQNAEDLQDLDELEAGGAFGAVSDFEPAFAPNSGAAVVSQGFIYTKAPFPSCHASTIEQTKSGALLAAWFGGTREGASDVDIWLSRHEGAGWSVPVKVATGVEPTTGIQYPTWNPVLFQPSGGPLLLFYKVGPNPREWWGMMQRSEDGGNTWFEPVRLRKGIYGPIKNKPIDFGDGVFLAGSSTEDAGWRVHMEKGFRYGRLWERTKPLHSSMVAGAIQPTVLNWGNDRLQILCRTKQRQVLECWSENNGLTWGEVRFTALPNSSSGLDAVMLQDGRALLVYNHTKQGRSPLNIALSSDGKVWRSGLVLEDQPGEYSYPAVIQARDGKVHITYTWKRQRIKHVVVDPSKLQGRPMVKGQWR